MLDPSRSSPGARLGTSVIRGVLAIGVDEDDTSTSCIRLHEIQERGGTVEIDAGLEPAAAVRVEMYPLPRGFTIRGPAERLAEGVFDHLRQRPSAAGRLLLSLGEQSVVQPHGRPQCIKAYAGDINIVSVSRGAGRRALRPRRYSPQSERSLSISGRTAGISFPGSISMVTLRIFF